MIDELPEDPKSFYSSTRQEVIETSIVVESAVARILAEYLEIDIESSITLGSKSSALSFRQKLDLLLDIKAIDKSIKPKMLKFAEIRNQFAHNLEATDLSSCMSFLDGCEQFFDKWYGTADLKQLEREERLVHYYEKLAAEILFEINRLIEDLENRHSAWVKTTGSNLLGEAFMDEMTLYVQQNQEFYPAYDRILKLASERAGALLRERYDDSGKEESPSRERPGH